jgi:SAM-dependent methyltransferase
MVAPTSTWYQLAYRALEAKAEIRWEFTVVLEHLTRSDKVYEIGCGAGAFLKLCRERGIDAFGVDFSQDAIDACAKLGFAAEWMDVGLRARPRGQAATVVASFHVLEHLECADDMFRAAAMAADDRASLWISVPSCRRVSARLVLPDPLDDPPHHLTKWTEAALASVGARNGWHFEELLYEPFSWRSALWSVASVSRPYAWFRAHGWTRLPGFERALRAVLYPAAFIRLLRSPRRNELTGFAMIGRFRKVSTH